MKISNFSKLAKNKLPNLENKKTLISFFFRNLKTVLFYLNFFFRQIVP
jgi:hypothetical protein